MTTSMIPRDSILSLPKTPINLSLSREGRDFESVRSERVDQTFSDAQLMRTKLDSVDSLDSMDNSRP